MKKLFIGGPANGQWLDTNDKDYVRVPSKLATNGFEHVTYIMQRWHADGEQLHVFSPAGQSPSDTMKLLIEHYRPDESNN